MDLKTLHKISYGLYIVTSGKDDDCNGQIANTVIQVTADPPRVGVCINKQNYTHEFISKYKVFSASILSQEAPMKLIGLFGFKCGRDLDKFEDVEYKVGETGSKIVLNNAVGYLEVKVFDSVDVGTHTMFIGDLVAAETLSDAEPITYAYYHEIKGGKSPKTAPTYIKEKKVEQTPKKERKKMAAYECTVCGYVYDPQEGDPENGIDPGTPFRSLPEDWVCPVCGAGKEDFEKIEEY
ncbi:flavin reductase [bacterium]|nr:flavin reductase [bacterium]